MRRFFSLAVLTLGLATSGTASAKKPVSVPMFSCGCPVQNDGPAIYVYAERLEAAVVAGKIRTTRCTPEDFETAPCKHSGVASYFNVKSIDPALRIIVPLSNNGEIDSSKITLVDTTTCAPVDFCPPRDCSTSSVLKYAMEILEADGTLPKGSSRIESWMDTFPGTGKP